MTMQSPRKKEENQHEVQPVSELDPRKPTVAYRAGGYRSSVAASVLRQRGFDDVSDVLGGYDAWDEATQNA